MNDITEIFKKVCEKHGYEDVEVDFSAFKEFKVKWSRSHSWIRFAVSDYLKNAPVGVWENVAEVIMQKIAGEQSEYSAEAVAWFESKDFLARNQRTYIRRHARDITDADTFDLEASRWRLIEKGLVEEDEDVMLYWGKSNGTKAGNASVLMKTVIMNGSLIGADTELLDLALYVQLTVIGKGFRPNEFIPTGTIAEGYPDAGRLEEELACKVGLTL